MPEYPEHGRSFEIAFFVPQVFTYLAKHVMVLLLIIEFPYTADIQTLTITILTIQYNCPLFRVIFKSS